MKSCSSCATVYADEGLNFCLEDGTRLTNLLDAKGEELTRVYRLSNSADLRPRAVGAQTLIINTSPSRTTRQPVRSKAIDSIVVLPFANVGVDPDTEYISDGITENIINLLSRLPKLRVVARNTAFRYKGQGADLSTISRQLDVRAVLTGRVRRAGDRLIIGTELVDAERDAQFWGEHFNFKLEDIFEVQEQIAKAIAEKLSLKLSRKEKKRQIKRHTPSTEAYELYLKGRFHWNQLTEEGFRKSIEFFAQACERDAAFAPAHSGLADAYGALGYFNYVSPREAFPSSRKYAERALEIDDTLAEAHLSLAWVKFIYEWDWQQAELAFNRAIELRPGYATAHHIYGHYLASLGRFEQAIAEMKLAHKLDPLSVIIGCSLGFTYYRSRNYDAAVKQFQNVLDLIPALPLAHEGLAAAYLEKGNHDEAFAEQTKAIRHWPESEQTILILSDAYQTSGIGGYRREWIEQCTKHRQPNYVTSYHIAAAWSSIGEKDRAFAALEKAFAERIGFLVYLKVEPIFDNLRTDARFTDLLRRVGLEQ